MLTGGYNRKEQANVFQNYSKEQRLEAALTAGEKLHPGFRDKVFAENGVSIAWAKMPCQQGGWANDTAYSQPDVFSEVVASDSSNNRVLFAGDWFSYWPGWQVGALDSAHYATDRIHRLALNKG